DVLAHGGIVAEARSVAAQIASLDMRRVYNQSVAFPLPGREPRPAMWSVIGRMGTAIHVDYAIERPQILDMNRAELAPDRIDFIPEPHASQRAPLVRRRVRTALKLRQAPLRVVVAVRLATPGIVEGNALIVAQRRAAGTFVAVFVNALGPNPGKVRQLQNRSPLAEDRGASCHQGEQESKEAHGIP